MMITPDFVFVHFTKTGGTYVAKMLARVYGDQGLDIDQHGTCNDIPEEHRGKPIVSTIRNPFDRYVSQYRYGWWKVSPQEYCGEDAMREMFPHYPDITFAEFLELANTKFMGTHRCAPNGYANERFAPERRLGWHTESFVRFYFRNPRQLFAQLDEEALASGSFLRDMYDVRFLHTGGLRRELYDYLVSIGHQPEDVAFILSSERVLPDDGLRDRPENDPWESYYTPALKDYVRTRERLIFGLFPEFDQENLAEVEG